MATNYPLIMQEYAECSAEQVMKKYSRKEYLEISKKPIEEQKIFILPLIKDCLSEMNRKVDSLDRKRNTLPNN